MNDLKAERIIRRTRYLFVFFYLATGFSAMKYAFHFDPHNGYSVSLKEPATFLVYFLLAITCGLRYNKRLNLYYGALAIVGYSILIAPNALRVSHEFPKLLFFGAFISNVELDTLTRDLLGHFNNQRALIERIIGWLEKMSGTSVQVSLTLGALVELSTRLEDRSVAMNDLLKTVNV